MRPVIILFAKAPVPGRVKTRLIPPLSASRAASLHSAFVWDMIERLQSLRDLDLELHTDRATDEWRSAGLPQLLQCEGDLGLKMFQALRLKLSAGRPQAMIAGTDAPTLPLKHLETLLESQRDVALGPADDGGYYAIACRRVAAHMFQRVEWSCPDTFAQTVAAVEASGLTLEPGPGWWDVDTPEDLQRLRAATDLPRHTARFLREGEPREGEPNDERSLIERGRRRAGDPRGGR